MTGSLFFMLILGLGVAVPYAKSGKSVRMAFRWSAGLLLVGVALIGLGVGLLTTEDVFNGVVNLPIVLGILPAALGGVGVVMTVCVIVLRAIGFRSEESET